MPGRARRTSTARLRLHDALAGAAGADAPADARAPPARGQRLAQRGAGALGAATVGAAIADVAVAARAVPAPAGRRTMCLAAPLHVVAGMQPRASAARRLAAARTPREAGHWLRHSISDFGGAGSCSCTQWLADWLLAAPCAARRTRCRAGGHCSANLWQRAPARDDAERALRRLGAEVEIWLAGPSAEPCARGRAACRRSTACGSGAARAPWPIATAGACRRARCWLPVSRCLAGRPGRALRGCRWAVPQAGRSMRRRHDALLVLAPPPQRSDDGTLAARWKRTGSCRSRGALRRGEISALRLQIGATRLATAGSVAAALVAPAAGPGIGRWRHEPAAAAPAAAPASAGTHCRRTCPRCCGGSMPRAM